MGFVLFILYIPLIMFIAAEIVIIYQLIRIVYDAFIRYMPSGNLASAETMQAMTYIFALMVAVLIVIAIYMRFVIRPVSFNIKVSKITKITETKKSPAEQEKPAVQAETDEPEDDGGDNGKKKKNKNKKEKAAKQEDKEENEKPEKK